LLGKGRGGGGEVREELLIAAAGATRTFAQNTQAHHFCMAFYTGDHLIPVTIITITVITAGNTYRYQNTERKNRKPKNFFFFFLKRVPRKNLPFCPRLGRGFFLLSSSLPSFIHSIQ
jgi:hypothetical protein